MNYRKYFIDENVDKIDQKLNKQIDEMVKGLPKKKKMLTVGR